MKCPDCGLTNPPEAIRCDCGFDFRKNTVYRPIHSRGKDFPTAVVVFILIGVLIITSIMAISRLNSIDKSLKAIVYASTEKLILGD